MYYEIKSRISQELNDFPMRFAFSNQQFEDILTEWNIAPEDLIRIPHGGFIRRTDKQAFLDLYKRHDQEMEDFLKDDAALIDAMRYELANHEYCITYDADDALRVFGLSVDSLTEREQACLQAAKDLYWQDQE